ncbi:DUF6011 domain-containing protein [Methylorubrum thiocyanatum]|uniref:DUF6011 domain-containing protein n=1 Tax=Methylorubrum thiocyanatum TaxID=47958 RepID=UPI00398C49E6
MTQAKSTTIFTTNSNLDTHCKVCGRPLSDELSMRVGMGPTCRTNAGPRTPDLFTSRADYSVETDGDVLILVDLDRGGRSLTNDADNVILDLAARGFLRDGMRVIYRDSSGEWDELRHRGGLFSTISPIPMEARADREAALAWVFQQYGPLGVKSAAAKNLNA